jgi:hypothetical protein
MYGACCPARTCITIHAFERALERYEIRLTPALAARWARQIDQGRARLVVSHGPDCKVYDVVYKGRTIRIVWNPICRTVITVMPAVEKTKRLMAEARRRRNPRFRDEDGDIE